jgi:hypothetical protein
MRESIESRLARNLEAKVGPTIVKFESVAVSNIRIRWLAILIFIVTALWWACRLFHPQFLRFRFLETVCLDIMVVGPFANLVLLVAFLISSARSGWPGSRWAYPAVICAVSPWPVVLLIGLLGGTGVPAPP